MMHILRYFITGIIALAGFQQLFAQAETQNPNSAAGLYWRVKGNAGTSTSTNFIGTTDNVGLWFRTNNQVRMIIDSIGRVGIGAVPRFKFNVVGSGADTVLADFTHSPIFAEMMNQSSVRVKSGPALFTTTLNSANALEILSGYGTNTLISRGINLVNASSSEVNYGIRNLANGGGISVTDSVIGVHSMASGAVRNIAMRGGAITSGTANTQNIGVQGFASGATDNWAGYFGNNAVGDGLVFIKDALSIGSANPVAELYVGGLGANVVIDAVGTGGGAVAASTATTDRLLYANTNGYVNAIPSGSAGDVLALSSNGPTWVSPSLGAWSLSGNNAGASDFIGTTNTESFRFRTNNIQRMVITSGGLVGIGTALPLYKFHMTDTSSNTTMASLNHVHTGSSGAPTGLLVTATNTGTAGILYGTYSQTLNSATAAETNALAAFNPSTGTTNRGIRAWALGSTTGTNYGIQAYASNAGTNWAGYFGFSTAGDGKVYVKDTLAINTTLPARRFHMAGTTSGMRYGGVATGGSFITTPSAGTDKIMYADAAGDIRAMSGGTTGQVLTYTTSGPAWSTAASNDWGLTGNASTVDGTNFIGTTDNVAFNFRVNSQKAGRIGTASDGNVFLGYQAGLNDNLLNNYNTFIGYQAGRTNIGGYENTATGYQALYTNTGYRNTATGYMALNKNTTGTQNTAMGNVALFSNTSGFENTAVGDAALNANTTGTYNTATGRAALNANTTGYRNTSSGYNSLGANTSGYENSAFGFNALSFNTSGYENVALGVYALSANTTGDQNVSVGHGAGEGNIVGNANTYLGYLASSSDNLTNATAIGNRSFVAGSNRLVLGASNLFNGSTTNTEVGIGTPLPNARLDVNGDFALRRRNLLITTAVNNNLLLDDSMSSYEFPIGIMTSDFVITGFAGGENGKLVYITNNSGYTCKIVNNSFLSLSGNRMSMAQDTLVVKQDGSFTLHYSTLMGTGHWRVVAFTEAYYKSGMIGGFSGEYWATSGNSGTSSSTHFIGTTDNIALAFRTNNQRSGLIDPLNSNSLFGYWAGRDMTTGTQNVAVGTNALLENIAGIRNTAIGTSTLENNTSSNNIGVGYAALTNNTTGYSNVAMGTQALFSNTTKNNLVAVGDSALFNNGLGATLASQAVNNVAVGSKALFSNTTSSDNTAVGFEALQSVTTAFRNTAVGSKALKDNTAGGNTAVGTWTLENNSTGSSNTAMGIQAMQGNNTGSENVAMGLSALFSGSANNSNTGIGAYALNSTNSYGNTALGHKAGFTNTTGYRNTLVGDSADVLVSSLTNATAMGYFAKVSASNNLILGDTVNRPAVGIGVTAVGKTLARTIFEIATEGVVDNMLYRYHGSNEPTFNFQRSVGSLASPTAVFTGAALGRLDFWGYEGANWDVGARISVEVDSNITPGIVPSRIVFYTQNSAGVLDDRMYINRSGNVGINYNLPAVKLHVDGGVAIAPRGITFTATTDNFPVTIDNESYIRVSQTGGTLATDRTIVLSNGLAIGQLLYVECTAGFIEFLEGTSNVQCGAAVTMGSNDIAHFIWNGTDWLMVSVRAN